MAKYLAQVVVAGVQVVGRAFARALRQEIQASQAAAAARQKSNGGENSRQAATNSYLGMSVQEAKQILNISDLNPEEVQKNYDHLFQANDKSKGGSFYLQSKVVRAHERIMEELKSTEKEATQKEQKDNSTS